MAATDPAVQTFDMPAGARWGTLIGYTAWAFALAAMVASAGHPLLALEVGAIAVACGAGLAQLTILAIEAVDRAGASRGRRLRVLYGALAVSIGLLMLVWGLGLAPYLAEHPDVVDALGRVGGNAVLPAWVCGVIVAIGAVLLAIPDRDATD